MNPATSPIRLSLLGAGVALCAALAHADALQPREFAWRAPLEVPAGASLARAEVPAPALMRLHSRDARDLRIFNAAGEPVPFAPMEPPRAPPPPAARTGNYPALPLFSPVAGARQPKGSMQVRIDDPGQQRSVWVQMDGAQVADAPKLNAVLFATKDEKNLLSGVDVQATLPANTPVRMSAFSSADLAQWTPLPVRGRLYRFDGAGAPVNMTLEFERPVNLEDRYLRLDWHGQEGVEVTGVAGVIAQEAQTPVRVRGELQAPQAAAAGAVELATGFLTPMAGLALSTPTNNALLPVRILGRNDASQPWRLLGQTVVYRLGATGSEAVNPPVNLYGASASRLRIESTNGSDLGAARLQASAEFEPMRLVFVATGAGPFELAAGRADTPPAALPLATIAGALGPRKVEDLPAAGVGAATIQAAQAGPLARVWPGGEAPTKTTVLWAVLIAGVLMLAAVAWSLLRQLKRTEPPAEVRQ
jgi:hypothetical protein